jgi:hypothetical protein
MAKAMYDKGREAFLGPASGQVNWANDNIKAVLVNLAAYGKAITGATNATPIVVTATAHGFSNGDVVAIKQVGGNAAANGLFKVANVTTNTFELTNVSTGANVAGSGAYTSGGYAVDLTLHQYLSDIAGGARVATSGNLASKTTALGVADAADVTFTAVTGSQVDAVVVYKDTGTASTSPLICYADDYTNLPVTPNGGDINISWDNGANKIFKL